MSVLISRYLFCNMIKNDGSITHQTPLIMGFVRFHHGVHHFTRKKKTGNMMESVIESQNGALKADVNRAK